MADVFISHRHEDRKWARLIADSLEGLGFSVWWDFKMRAGESFREKIEAMLRACKVAIVLWSPGAVQSRFVRSEASRAQAMGKLAPVMIMRTELPLGLDEAHTIDLTDWRGEVSDQNFQALLREIETRTGRPALMAARSRGAVRAAPRERPMRAAPVAPPANRVRLLAAGVLTIGLIAVAGIGAHRSEAPATNTAEQAAAAESRLAPSDQGRSPASANRPLSQAALLALVESLPFERRSAFAQARRDFEMRDHAGPFAVRALHPSVRRAVREALRASAFATAAAARARIAAQRAEDAAKLAEAHAPGTIIEDVGDRHWATDWANDAHNGFGTLSWRDGDRYAGAWRDGRFEGPGVFHFESETDRVAGPLQYEGDFSAGRRSGSGVLVRRNGERYAGALAANMPEGAGVHSYANGERYEGQWRAGKRDGFGVLWSAGGDVIQGGLWRRDRLASALASDVQ